MIFVTKVLGDFGELVKQVITCLHWLFSVIIHIIQEMKNPYAWLEKDYEEEIYGGEQDATPYSNVSSIFFDLDPTFFAQLFRPKNEMCNKRKSNS